MSTLTLSFLGRFCRAFRLVGSHLPGERENAAHAMYRLCAGEGVSITDLAIALENSDHEIAEKKYTDEDAVAIFVRGVEKGRAESRGRLLSASYFDEDGEPRWVEIAKFCHEHPALGSLKPNEQQFVDELQAKLRWRPPSRAMGGFALSIFWKLGGSFK